jgi:hypothetical protein
MNNAKREALLSYFAWLIGGWNASKGLHAGRLQMDVDINDDEAVARHMLATYKADVEKPLLAKIAELELKLAKKK